ncbi:MAG TPA: hypothetical protein DEP23_04505 [Ruminococcaceae bacterium]|nr:hypothetical protein [Oscillospiraceae bacterium]
MTKEEIATTLKLCRINAGFNAKDVAEKLISMGAIKSVKSFYNWESGRTQPDADTFMYLCNLYNVEDIMSTFGHQNSSSKFSDAKRSSEDDSLLSDFHKLNRKGREAALGAVKGFTFVPEYTNIEDEEAI